MASAVFRAKRTLLAQLAALTRPGGDLAGVQVAYGPPRDMSRNAIYFGNSRLSWEPAVAEAPQVAMEIAQTDVVVRAVAADIDGLAVEATAEALVGVVTDQVCRHPQMAGTDVWMSIIGGSVTQTVTDDERVCSVSLTLSSRGPR